MVLAGWPMEIFYGRLINGSATKIEHSHWSTGHCAHLWMADKSQTNLWAILSAGPCIDQTVKVYQLLNCKPLTLCSLVFGSTFLCPKTSTPVLSVLAIPISTTKYNMCNIFMPLQIYIFLTMVNGSPPVMKIINLEISWYNLTSHNPAQSKGGRTLLVRSRQIHTKDARKTTELF